MTHDPESDHGHGAAGHAAGHAHGHARAHTHDLSAESDHRYLTITLGLLVAFMAFEVVTAFLSHSLALLADAGHMLADVGAIAGSLVALRLAARPRRVRTRSA